MCQKGDAANLHPSSYAPAWTVKSKKYQKKIQKSSNFFLRETLTKVLSACKNSSWKHIPRRRGKKNKNSTLKKLLSNAFWSTEFVFLPRLTGMWFHDEFLQALRTFVNVSLKKIGIFWIFFRFFFDFTVHAGAYELGCRLATSGSSNFFAGSSKLDCRL